MPRPKREGRDGWRKSPRKLGRAPLMDECSSCKELEEKLAKLQLEHEGLKKEHEAQKAKEESTCSSTGGVKRRRMEQEYSELCKRCNEKDDEINNLKANLQQSKQKIEDSEKCLEEEKKEKDKALNKSKQEIEDLKKSREEEMKERDDALNRAWDKIEDLERRLKDKKAKDKAQNRPRHEIEDLKIQLEEERKAKDDALNRLSAMISSKMRDNNPNIADLSDQNRPTKLAEKMSELYDNEWTEAYEEMEERMDMVPLFSSEEGRIKHLFELIMTIYEECRKWSCENYFERVQQQIECWYKGTETEQDEEDILSSELKVQLKDLKKKRAPYVLPSINKMLSEKLPELNNPENSSEYLQKYIQKCIEICWFAVVQDPPVVVSAHQPDAFDKNFYRAYTKSGKYIEFVVWPVLQLHENGPVLAKGVAQGTETKQQNNAEIIDIDP